MASEVPSLSGELLSIRGANIDNNSPLNEARQRVDPNRSLSQPHPSRLAVDHPQRAQILAAHDEAMAAGRNGYADPLTGRFAICASYLAKRGWCCDSGCRHCPYVTD